MYGEHRDNRSYYDDWPLQGEGREDQEVSEPSESYLHPSYKSESEGEVHSESYDSLLDGEITIVDENGTELTEEEVSAMLRRIRFGAYTTPWMSPPAVTKRTKKGSPKLSASVKDDSKPYHAPAVPKGRPK